MDEVYRLFDRRCRTDTALVKLERLRQKVKRYRSLGRSLDKLKSPSLEKALTFLDERLLGALSCAQLRTAMCEKPQPVTQTVLKQSTAQSQAASSLRSTVYPRDRVAAPAENWRRRIRLHRRRQNSDIHPLLPHLAARRVRTC